MEEEKKFEAENLGGALKAYIEKRIEIGRFQFIEKASGLAADFISNSFIAICLVLAFILGMFSLGFYLSDWLQSYIAGFGIIALLYLIIPIVLLLTRDKFIEPLIANIAIRKSVSKFMEEEENGEV